MTTIWRNNICNVDDKHLVSLEYKASFKTLEKYHLCIENGQKNEQAKKEKKNTCDQQAAFKGWPY